MWKKIIGNMLCFLGFHKLEDVPHYGGLISIATCVRCGEMPHNRMWG
jgi:hypothetical protein